MDELTFFQRIGGGNFMAKVLRGAEEIAADVIKTGKKGRVTISLEFERFKDDNALVIVTETIKLAPPTEKSNGAMFYSVEGELHRDDPRQTVMDFRVVDERVPLRAADEIPTAVKEAN